MLVIPAVDIRGGFCVRLIQGRKTDETIYSEDPSAMAKKWESEGAAFLHVVDLDGAFEGEPRNLKAIREIMGAVSIPVEVGGGIRTMDAIAKILSLGVERVILGTRAAMDPEFVKEALERFDARRIVAGIDAHNGLVSTEGWTKRTDIDAVSLALQMKDTGVIRVIYTDVQRDGMLTGPNITGTRRLAIESKLKIILSGGISSLDDVRRVARLEADGIEGMIIGKALYEGRLLLTEVIRETGSVTSE